MAMKNKKDLLIAAIALVSILFIVILLIASGALKPSAQEEEAEVVVLEEEAELISQEENAEVISQEMDGFAKRFGKELPEGYVFAETLTANPERDHLMQMDILDENDAPTDISIVFAAEDTENIGSQMALTIKEDCIPDDADAILKWYLFTFLEGYTEEKKKAIYNDYLYLFDTGSKEYRVYTEENLTTMMSLEAEKGGNYYYVMVDAE